LPFPFSIGSKETEAIKVSAEALKPMYFSCKSFKKSQIFLFYPFLTGFFNNENQRRLKSSKQITILGNSEVLQQQRTENGSPGDFP
jgi:hypothetical protein